MTSTDRRTALRTGAGLLAAGALTAGCATSGAVAHSSAPAHPSTDPATASAAPTPRGYPGQPAQLTHGPRTHPRVALTFHGQGDPAVAHSLLTAAEKHDARLTVLAVGTWLDEHPDVARRILDGGHDLGNHTQRHLAVNTMSEADARTEITACADRLRRLTGSIGTWFRPSRAPSRPRWSYVWPAAPAIRTSSRTTSTPSTTPGPVPTPSYARSSVRSGPGPW